MEKEQKQPSEYVVWIDQDLCTGDALCAELVPDVFMMHEDGLAYVQDEAGPKTGPGDTVDIPLRLLGLTIQAADDCPGECIYIEQRS